MRFEVGDTVYIAFEIDDERMINKNPFKIEGIDIKIRKNYKNTTYLLTNGVICSEDNIFHTLKDAEDSIHRCKYYGEVPNYVPIYNYDGSIMMTTEMCGVCKGTPEKDPCPFGGDKEKCDKCSSEM